MPGTSYAEAAGRNPGISCNMSGSSAQVTGFKDAEFITEKKAQASFDEHGRKRTLDVHDLPDTPEEPMEYEAPALDIPEEIRSLNSRLDIMKSKVNASAEQTTKSLENLNARVMELESVSQNSAKRPKLENNNSIVTEYGFTKDFNGFVIVYTDGACSKNGRHGAKAGIGVWFGEGHPLNVSAPLKGRPTNNSAEIQAARVAITKAASAGVKKLKIHTDSEYLVNSITQWIHRLGLSSSCRIGVIGDFLNNLLEMALFVYWNCKTPNFQEADNVSVHWV